MKKYDIEEEINAYISNSCMQHTSIEKDLLVYEIIKTEVHNRDDLNKIEEINKYIDTMRAYIRYKKLYIEDEKYESSYLVGYGIIRMNIDGTFVENNEKTDELEVGEDYNRYERLYTNEYTYTGVRYNPFDKNLLRLILNIIKTEYCEDLEREFKNCLQEKEIQFNEKGKVEYLDTWQKDACNKKLRAIGELHTQKAKKRGYEKEVEIVNNKKEILGKNTEKSRVEYINLLRKTIENQINTFKAELFMIRTGYWKLTYKELVVDKLFGPYRNVDKYTEEEIEVYETIKDNTLTNEELRSMMAELYEDKVSENARRYKNLEDAYKEVEPIQEQYRHILVMTVDEKLMYIDRLLANIMNNFYIMIHAIAIRDGIIEKKENGIISKSIAYAVTYYIRNVMEHPIDYREHYEKELFIFNVSDLRGEIEQNNTATRDFDIYFNLDRYVKGLIKNNTIHRYLYKNHKIDYDQLYIRLNKNGEREVLVFKDTTYVGNSKYERKIRYEDSDHYIIEAEEYHKSLLTILNNIQEGNDLY